MPSFHNNDVVGRRLILKFGYDVGGTRGLVKCVCLQW